MNPLHVIKHNQPQSSASQLEADPAASSGSLLRRLWGGFLVIIGYLLSPLCWWNDLIINLPIALGFGYLFSRIYPESFIAFTIVGYWLSNVVGFMLIQQGTVTALNPENQSSSGQSLRNGLLTSTAYTLAIVVLLHLHILDTPDFFSGDVGANLTAMLPDWLPF